MNKQTTEERKQLERAKQFEDQTHFYILRFCDCDELKEQIEESGWGTFDYHGRWARLIVTTPDAEIRISRYEPARPQLIKELRRLSKLYEQIADVVDNWDDQPKPKATRKTISKRKGKQL